MNALMAGGPLNGQVLELEDDTVQGFMEEDEEGGYHEYKRRTMYTYAGQDWVLFVCGELSYEQVLEVIRNSDMTDTGKRRVLGPGYELANRA